MRPLLRSCLVLGTSCLVASLVPLASLMAQATAPAAPAPLPSVTLPPALERVLRDYERAWAAKDAATLAALFAEDGFILQMNRPPVRGRAAIQTAYAEQSGGELRLRALAYATADTVGYIVGAYGFGDSPAEVGKYTLTLRRARDGRWLIFSDMDNPSQAPRRMAPPPASATPPAAP